MTDRSARVFAVGDSVMQGAGPDLYATLPVAIPGVEVDAAPSRQYWHAAPIISARSSRAPAPAVVVVHLGTNGVPSATQLDEVISSAADAQLVLVNVRAPREWETETNQRLADAVDRHAPRARLVDWWTLTNTTDGWLKQDGFHLTREGAVAYAHHIARAVEAQLAPRSSSR
jgi:lysophospholipase L1-like esterase